jgi:hypothetical protein
MGDRGLMSTGAGVVVNLPDDDAGPGDRCEAWSTSSRMGGMTAGETLPATTPRVGRALRWSRRASVGFLVVSVSALVWMGTSIGKRSYLVLSMDEVDLTLFSVVATVAALAVVAVLAAPWQPEPPRAPVVRASRSALGWLAGLAALASLPVLVFMTALSGIGHYTSLGVFEGREYLVHEATFDETGLTVFERHGLEVVPVDAEGTMMTGGRPFENGHFAVEETAAGVTARFPSGELTFTPAPR